MRSMRVEFIFLFSLPVFGCYTGAEFNLDASSLERPVSMSQFIHNDELKVLGPGDYEEISSFTMSFTGWSIGWPLDPHPRKDLSDRLNELIRGKGGDGITGLTVTVGNHPLNNVTMFVKGVSWFVLVGGSLVLVGNGTNKADALPFVGVSLANILFLPTAAEFTVRGTVIRFNRRKPESDSTKIEMSYPAWKPK